MLARQRTAAGGHNLCMKSLAKAYMDLERVRRNTAQNTAISQTGFDFNPPYHIENIENAKAKTCLSLRLFELLMLV